MHLICHIIKEIYNHTIIQSYNHNILFLINSKKDKIKKMVYFNFCYLYFI